MKYVIAGSTSGTGHAVLKRFALKVDVQDMTCIVRDHSDISVHKELGIKVVQADITNAKSYQKLLDQETVFIDMTHPKYYDVSIRAITEKNVQRAFFITTTGIFSEYNQFSEIYKVNEKRIVDSGITYTILRPSMIYGHLRDRNMSRLIKFLNSYPVFPLFGSGKSLMQPVFVDDLADGIVSAIFSETSENQAYNLCGSNAISYKNLIETILYILDRKVHLLNIPLNIATFGAKLGFFIPKFPITEEQVLRLQEDKVFDISKSISELNYEPREFIDGIAIEINQMRSANLI